MNSVLRVYVRLIPPLRNCLSQLSLLGNGYIIYRNSSRVKDIQTETGTAELQCTDLIVSAFPYTIYYLQKYHIYFINKHI